MNEDIRRRVGVMRGDTLSVKVSPEVVPDDHDDHSFKTVSERASEDGVVTVTLGAGLTRLRVGGAEVTFDAFRYFPRNPDDYDVVDYRGDVGDTTIDFEDVVDLSDRHAARNMTVARLVDGLENGSITPLPKK